MSGQPTEVDLKALLDDVDQDVKVELSCKPEVIDKGHELDINNLPIVARKWHKLTDGVAVVADLKSSTQLGLNKHAASTASIYEAATGSVVQIFDEFDADFVAIQGDGAFALFWGDNRLARAVCAGITIKTFSRDSLVPRLESKWPGLPETGLKVGVANSPLLVKRVGVPRTDHQEPVWAGRAVNYAAKAAQQADRHQMIVTGAIWDWASANDYLAVSCSCGGPSSSIWQDVTIEKIFQTAMVTERASSFFPSGAKYMGQNSVLQFLQDRSLGQMLMVKPLRPLVRKCVERCVLRLSANGKTAAPVCVVCAALGKAQLPYGEVN